MDLFGTGLQNLSKLRQCAAELAQFNHFQIGRHLSSWVWPEVDFYHSAASENPNAFSHQIIVYDTNVSARYVQGAAKTDQFWPTLYISKLLLGYSTSRSFDADNRLWRKSAERRRHQRMTQSAWNVDSNKTRRTRHRPQPILMTSQAATRGKRWRHGLRADGELIKVSRRRRRLRRRRASERPQATMGGHQPRRKNEDGREDENEASTVWRLSD